MNKKYCYTFVKLKKLVDYCTCTCTSNPVDLLAIPIFQESDCSRNLVCTLSRSTVVYKLLGKRLKRCRAKSFKNSALKLGILCLVINNVAPSISVFKVGFFKVGKQLCSLINTLSSYVIMYVWYSVTVLHGSLQWRLILIIGVLTPSPVDVFLLNATGLP